MVLVSRKKHKKIAKIFESPHIQKKIGSRELQTAFSRTGDYDCLFQNGNRSVASLIATITMNSR